jgi:hypothetical protein
MKKILLLLFLLIPFQSFAFTSAMQAVVSAGGSPDPKACNGTTYTNAATCTYYNRVIADGGTVINLAQVDVAFTLDNTTLVGDGDTVVEHYNASFGVKKDGSGYITTLYGLKGNDCTGHGTTNKPTYTTSVQNGHAGITFTSSDKEYFDCGNVTGLAGATSGYVVATGFASSVVNYSRVLAWGDFTAANNFYLAAIGGSTNRYYTLTSSNGGGSTSNSVITTLDANSNAVNGGLISWKLDADWKIQATSINNDASAGTSTANTLTPAGSKLIIGDLWYSGAIYTSLFWLGTINEVILLSNQYSTAGHGHIKTYINNWWALW